MSRPTLEVLPARVADRGLAKHLPRVRDGKARLVIERYGQPIAVICSLADAVQLEQLEDEAYLAAVVEHHLRAAGAG